MVAEREVADTNPAELAQLIVGADLPGGEARTNASPGHMVLEISDLSVVGDRGHLALKSLSMVARAGEIVGIAGVDGNGQRELFRAIAGHLPVKVGRLAIDGRQALDWSPMRRLTEGLRVIPEDRHAEGVVEHWSLEENSALGLHRLAPLAKGGRVAIQERKRWAEKVAKRFRTRYSDIGQPMSELSGGNQQRFVAARALGLAPKLILAFQPARGLDLGGAADVYAGIRHECNCGSAAVIVSFDLDELIDHCDRVLVLNDGSLYEPSRMDRDEIGRLMVGAG
jgi:simple sugar transport system ATP-binding protein